MTEWVEDAGFTTIMRDNENALQNLREWKTYDDPPHFTHGELDTEILILNWFLDRMRAAHPVVITKAQAEVLPAPPYPRAEMIDWLRRVRLPFDPLYIGFDPALDWIDKTGTTGFTHVQGALLTTKGLDDSVYGCHVAPVFKVSKASWPNSRWTYGTVGYMRAPSHDELTPRADAKGAEIVVELAPGAVRYAESAHTAAEQVAQCCAEALNTLYFLESANVEIVERKVTRQVRRHAERKGKQIAKEVWVRSGPRTASVARGGAANHDHRFEVMGRYNHHFAEKADGTPSRTFAGMMRRHPTRVVQVDGRDCFRIWQPPHVKGPADKPLVPKVRHVEGKSE